ncbi:MAG: HAMP domain-containing sensor histidine kinase [Acidimicrobiia bacterium]
MRRKIVVAALVVAAAMVTVGVGALVFIRNRVDARAADELHRQAEVTAAQLDSDLDRLRFRPTANLAATVRGLRSDLERSLERAQRLGGHDIVEGEIIVGSRSAPIVPPLVVLPLVAGETQAGEVVSVDVAGERMLVAVEEVETPNVTVRVAVGRSQPLVPLDVVSIPVGIAITVGAILVVLFGVVVGQSVTNRLSSLERAASAVGHGDLSTRVDDTGNDEINAVAVAFNAMTDQLASLRERERDFLMAVGHDLRTPLTTIRGYAEALHAGDISPNDLPRVADVLNSQADQLSRLVEDVMLLGRIEANQFTMRPEPVDVAALVRGVADGFVPLAAASSLRLTVELAQTGDRVVDPDRLSQVLSNLIENAMRYTPEMGTITLTVTARREEFALRVHNSGHGISDRDLPHVFERLYVAERYRAVRPSGSGLGLAIVSELVDAMGGTVTCDSDDHRGTSFCVSIPAPRT